ncbi:vitamin K epoxide reductase family protein [Haloferula sp.]|uniref:vitamin K epoxide reductase family protein n=1 Tax=Haloferula sp. TaxID=2497595 RepID=UPI003C7501D8
MSLKPSGAERTSKQRTADQRDPSSGIEERGSKGRHRRQVLLERLAVLLCIAGATLSGLLLQAHFAGVGGVPWVEGACGATEGGCSEVLASRWSVFPPASANDAPLEAGQTRGIPVAALGVFYFSLMGVWIAGRGGTVIAHRVILALAAFGCLTSLGWIGMMAFSLHSWCPICLSVHFLNFALLVMLWFLARKPEEVDLGLTTVGARPAKAWQVLLFALLLCVSQWFFHEAVALRSVNAGLARAAEDTGRLELEYYELERQDLEVRADDPTIEPSLPGTYSEIVYWGDVECPYCISFERLLEEEILPMFRGGLRVVFKHLPLREHRHALPAAKALEAARLQGRFHEMADEIKARRHHPDGIDLLDLATSLGMDAGQFESDMASASVSSRIQGDIRQFKELNPSGSIPTVFLNGRRLTNRMRSIPGFWKTQADALRRARLAQGLSWPDESEVSPERSWSMAHRDPAPSDPEPETPNGVEEAIAESGGLPRLELGDPVFRFGNVIAGSVVDHAFTLRNSGLADLKISGFVPGTGVSAATSWENRIEPGKTGELPLRFDTTGMAGAVSISTELRTNADVDAPAIRFEGEVRAGYEWEPKAARFNGFTNAGTMESVTIVLSNPGPEAVPLQLEKTGDTSFEARLDAVEAGHRYELSLRLSESAIGRAVTETVTLRTGEGDLISIVASAPPARRLWARPANVRLPPPGKMLDGAIRVVTIRSTNGEPFELGDVLFRQILDVAEADFGGHQKGAVESRVSSADDKRLWRIELRFPAGFELVPGARHGLVTMKSNLPGAEAFSIPVLQSKP